ncbi:hypothetical protein F4808DRAFT_405147 [Astrocystis sublimbata]|nr:hypothetical protein F4808DRAFT_405147 [Astrocystis sublimbata]
MDTMEQAQAYYETPGHIIAASVVLSVLDIVVVALRFWSRSSRNQGVKTDDWLIIPAVISTIAIGISMIYGTTQHALGYRTKLPDGFEGDPFDIVTYQLTTTSKIEFAYAILLPLTLGCVKSSFCFFYMRIFGVNKRSKTNILLIGIVVFVAVWAVAFSLASLFGCKLDIAAHWGSTNELASKCTGSMLVVLALCITDFAADLAIILIPIPLVWRLNLSTRDKAGISAVFLLGSVTLAASLARLIIEGRAVNIGFAPGSDSILVITEYLYWGFVECTVAILAACLPTLHGLMSHHNLLSWPKQLLKSRSSRSKETPPSPMKFNDPNAMPLAPVAPARHAPTDTYTYSIDTTGPTPGLRSMRSETPLIKPDATASSETRRTEEV